VARFCCDGDVTRRTRDSDDKDDVAETSTYMSSSVPDVFPVPGAEAVGSTSPPIELAPLERQTRMRAIVDEHIHFVARTLQKAGVPEAELDDATQRTFIAVANRLQDVHPAAERSFLFHVANNVAAHARRNLARRREVCSDELPDVIQAPTTPEHLAERKEMRKLLGDIADSMTDSLRSVFTLHEFEGMSTVEIAALVGIPLGTVASRLRRARAWFRQHVVAIELALDLGTLGADRIDGPARLRREKVGALGRALLDVGSAASQSASTRTKTLAALGVCDAPRRGRMTRRGAHI
jgi:RNA polymerase sigma-70 factor, ECF subfamily